MSSLLKIFANPSLAETLSLFLVNPEEEFYQFEIAQKTAKALIQIQRALKTLEEVGLVSSVRRGKMIYYKIVKNHPAFEDLKRLFLKTIALGEGIRQALLPLHDKIYLVFIFGSVARGDENMESDIDLFIVAELTLRELSKALSPLSKGLHRELNPIIFTPQEFQKRISQKDHFLVEVMNSPKLWILGNENEFRQMAKGRKTQTSSHNKR